MLTLVRRSGTVTATDTRRGRHAGLLFAAVVIVAGFIATALIVAGVRATQRENAGRVMDQRSAMARAAVLAETERYRSLLQATAAGLATDETITWEDYDAATSPLDSAGLSGAVSVAYVVPTSTRDIPDTQRRWRARGSDGLVLRPAGVAGEHYFTVFTRPLNDNPPVAEGLDLTWAPQPASALADARRTDRPTVSDTYVLGRDRNLPAERQQHSFVFAAPLWPRAPDPEFRGWIVLSMRGQDFLGGVLAAVSQGQLDGELLATSADGGRPAVAAYAVAGTTDLERRSTIGVADREWTLITRADSRRLPGARNGLPGAVLAGCAVITLILAGFVQVLAGGRARARARVAEATAELREAEAESRRQAALLSAIMTSLGDGVSVVDENGRFLLHNPASQKLVGVGDDVTGPEEWQAHYGLFRPDGHTPFPVEELPLLRALHGEPADEVEVLVRNRERPDGVLLSTNGRPLDPSAGLRGAVAVSRDITELRRYETDLAVFAGVVAHDLKAPLTVVRGHCELAIDVLDDASGEPAPAEARQALVRITRAVDRMSTMIDTLLAYTTARDAPLHTRTVDLAALATEVIHDRIAHLPADDRPEVHVGELPPVSADPAMLRHVLENLVGNALKYVRPGHTPRIEVTGTGAGAGLARIEVADRGIGIPDADKVAIFERFHRAHAGAGYGGTGLGLAICKRIVERHGGDIAVADNPGGGTRFAFTLPTPADSEPATSDSEPTAPDREPTASDREPTASDREPTAPDREPTAPDREPGPGDRMPDVGPGAEAARARLERALAERAAIQNAHISDLSGNAEPAAEHDTPDTGRAG
jgi:PAS domain S-box-containing protein